MATPKDSRSPMGRWGGRPSPMRLRRACLAKASPEKKKADARARQVHRSAGSRMAR